DGMRVLESGMALEPGDLVLLEQEGNAAGELLDRVDPLALHRLEVELRCDLDAEFGHRPARGGFEILGGVEHRLGRNAADVEASAAERFPAFDARGLEPELSGANGGDVSAGAGTDDEDVVVVFSHKSRHSLAPPLEGEVAAASAADGGGYPPGPALAAGPLHHPSGGPPPRERGEFSIYKSISIRIGSSIASLMILSAVTASRPSIRRWS